MARPGLTRHRKFLRLARMLDDSCPNFGTVVALGCLELLWGACYESGDPYLGDADDVEALAGWRGKRGELLVALLAAGGDSHCGFVDEVSEGRYAVHDLYDHAPEYVRRRAQAEHARRENGETVSGLRAKAGRLGGLAKAGKRLANASDLPADGWQTPEPGSGKPLANVATPNQPTQPPRTQPAQPAPTSEEPWLAGLQTVAVELGKALGRDKPLGMGKDAQRTMGEFARWLTTVGVEATVAECVRLAGEKGVTPSHLSWFVGWLETASNDQLRRASP